jgi:hypothetical protein
LDTLLGSGWTGVGYKYTGVLNEVVDPYFEKYACWVLSGA